jgi:hypothetical protein
MDWSSGDTIYTRMFLQCNGIAYKQINTDIKFLVIRIIFNGKNP